MENTASAELPKSQPEVSTPTVPKPEIVKPVTISPVVKYKSLMQDTRFSAAVLRDIKTSYPDILQTLAYCPPEFTEKQFITQYNMVNAIQNFQQNRTFQQIASTLKVLVEKSVLKIS